MKDRIRAWMSAPQIERKPSVTLRKVTLGWSARLAALLIGSTLRSAMKAKNRGRQRLVCCSAAPAAVTASRLLRRRSAVARYWAKVPSFKVFRRRPTGDRPAQQAAQGRREARRVSVNRIKDVAQDVGQANLMGSGVRALQHAAHQPHPEVLGMISDEPKPRHPSPPLGSYRAC